MSLDFNLAKIKDFKKVCWREDGRMNPMTETLIWGCLYADLGSITVNNFREFFHRINVQQGECGGLLFHHVNGKAEPTWITLKDVETHIGLTTNCTSRTRAGWLKKHPELKGKSSTPLPA